MTDVFSRGKRREIMRSVKSKDTGAEVHVRTVLRGEGIRTTRRDRVLPGSPDIVVAGFQVAVFVHGCFWHGHRDCPRAKIPRTNRKFWMKKITLNRRRDARVNRALRSKGWKVLVVWTCRAWDSKRLRRLLSDVRRRRFPAH